MRASVSGHVTLRPVRLGLIVEPTFADVLSAATAATGYWGGVTWPMIPFAHDAQACHRLGEAFDVDALVALSETEAASDASKKEGFSWAGGHVSPFSEDSAFRSGRPLELRSMLPRGRESSPYTCVTWDSAHPLAALAACAFGHLGDPVPEERADAARHADTIELKAAAPFPTTLTSPSLIAYTARDLRLGDRWSAAGFVVIHPESAEDLAWYWNIRAAGNSVRPWPLQHAELVADLADEWVKRLAEGWQADDSRPFQVVVWTRDREVPAELREIIARREATVGVAAIDHVRLVAEDRLPAIETGHSRRFDLELDDDANSARISLPSLPFVEGLPWWHRVGYVVADVHVTTEFNMRGGYRMTVPSVRWLSPALAVMPTPIEPFVRPISDGVAKAVEGASDYVTLWLVSSEALLTRVLERASLAPSEGAGRRLMVRLIEMLGGMPRDDANQPAVRQVLEAASRSPYGRPVNALAEEIRRHAGGWENSFGFRGGDYYSTRVLTGLTHAGMLAPVLRFDCLACGSANALPGDLIRESLKCQLCREEHPLAAYLAGRRKLSWHLALPQHLPIKQLRETYPVMASIAVIQDLHHKLEAPHVILSTRLVVDGSECEIDFAALIDVYGMPAILLSETKATRGEVDANDVAHLKALQAAIRATGIDCYILIAKLSRSLTDAEKSHLRALCEGPMWPVQWPAGMAQRPICPIILLHDDLSVHSFHEDHPWRRVDPPATITGLAEASCRQHLGLTGWERDHHGPIWDDG